MSRHRSYRPGRQKFSRERSCCFLRWNAPDQTLGLDLGVYAVGISAGCEDLRSPAGEPKFQSFLYGGRILRGVDSFDRGADPVSGNVIANVERPERFSEACQYLHTRSSSRGVIRVERQALILARNATVAARRLE